MSVSAAAVATMVFEVRSTQVTFHVLPLFEEGRGPIKSYQVHDNLLEILRHINLYFSMRRPQKIGFPGHVGTGFFKIPYFQEFCLSRPRFFSKIRQIIIKKKLRTPSLQGCAPLTHQDRCYMSARSSAG